MEGICGCGAAGRPVSQLNHAALSLRSGQVFGGRVGGLWAAGSRSLLPEPLLGLLSGGGSGAPPAGLDAAEQTLTLVLPNELAAGEHQLELKFSGKINPQGQGLFYAPYQEYGTNAKKIMLGTQFEPTDARRMFPCWDEPSFRAKFQLTAVVPENFVAVSNMPVAGEEKLEGKKEVRFETSPSMSSYLVVLCAGELDLVEAEQDGVKLRVVTTKGKAEMGRYALESEAKILRCAEDVGGPGGSKEWVSVATRHHLEMVSRQLANLS